MYKTKDPDIYYHTHGSLEATPIFGLLGLPGFREDLNDYNEICKVIQEKCSEFSADELDKGTEERKQAGSIVFKHGDFLKTEQVRPKCQSH